MMSPREKYENDPSYRALVDLLISFIYKCQFTPSELREAALLACIKYEEITIRPITIMATPEMETAFRTLENWYDPKKSPQDVG